jgi:Leucine-rich repeat (LRR) protein
LSGNIPPELENLVNLSSLALENNPLGGNIPPELGNLVNLNSLDLGNTQLNGAIPTSLMNLSNLVYLDINYNCLYTYDNDLRAWLDINDPDWEIVQYYCGSTLTITITSPNGGENWEVGSNQDITWTSTGDVRDVKIEYSTNSGSSWAAVISETPNYGYYSWSIPDTPSTNCKVRISEASDGVPTDESDSTFSIISTPTYTLTIQSSPDTSVPITVSPLDNNAQGDAGTNFTRVYTSGTIVTLTAPASFNGNDFLKWTVDSQEYTNLSIQVTMDNIHTASVFYEESIPGVERDALIALYNSTGGDNWTNNNGWKTPPLYIDGFAMPGTENEWQGIGLENYSVTQISLFNNNLSGTIPPNLKDLSNLQSLSMPYNNLSGTIPADLVTLSNLTILDLRHNDLSGAIPTWLGNLTNLVSLYLGYNGFTGSIPTTLMNLEQLASPYVDIGYNHLYTHDSALRAWLDIVDPDWETTQVILNQPPCADAGPGQTAHPGDSLILDGSDSYDPDENYPLTYSWMIVAKPADSQAELSTPDQVSTSITIDKMGDYIIGLVVTDSLGLSSPTSEIIISNVNSLPIASAGEDQAVTQVGTWVYLDGSQSWDPDGDALTYSWAFAQKPVGSQAGLSNPNSPNPSFVPDIYGEYRLSLVVSDPWVDSEPDEVTVSFENIVPVANAGNNQSCVVGALVTFDGSSSYDANGDPLTYSWQMVSRPAGSTAQLNNPGSVNPSFQPDEAGEYVVSLVVNDGLLNSLPASATVVAISVQNALTQTLQELINVINNMPSAAFKNKNMGNTLIRKISVILKKVDNTNYQGAHNQLEKDVFAKTNGCADTGSPDNNDWIVSCYYQSQVYPLIVEALGLLEDLI